MHLLLCSQAHATFLLIYFCTDTLTLFPFAPRSRCGKAVKGKGNAIFFSAHEGFGLLFLLFLGKQKEEKNKRVSLQTAHPGDLMQGSMKTVVPRGSQ